MHIKRSMPYFMILSLIMSSTVIGLVFNFNTSTKKLVNELFRPEAQAQNDTATTTVTVRNAAPTITIKPAEVFAAGLGSTSTTPVNIGASIGFSVTADDMEDNSYYLIVCTSTTATAGVAGAAPTCSGGVANTLCVSGLTGDTIQATCTYGSTVGANETKDWYAFACDNHATEADCSPYSQGSAVGVDATSSPMYINHAPVFTTGSTTVDFRQAGNNPFTFTATTTDTDTLGGFDVIQYDVCSTNSWATTTGCAAATVCSATSTISGGTAVVSCQATTTIPTVDKAYHYWGFVKDWHALAASSGNAVDRTYTVINTAPVVSSVVVNGGNPFTPNMKNSATTTIHITATVSDDNSCSDLTQATSTLYLSNVVGLQNCTADNDNCYQILSASCTQSACGGSTTTKDALYDCTAGIAFHSIPTDASANNSHVAENWLGAVAGKDEGVATVATSTIGQELATVQAIAVTELAIPYNTIKGGQDSGAYNATTTVINYGNCPINSQVSGTDMTGPAIIPILNQKYDLAPATYASLTNVASAVPTTLDINAPKPTTSVINIQAGIYWGINIPAGTLSGNYAGTNAFDSIIDGSVSW
ncbi:hypothetical protein KKD60_04010 [Patescibacteria group bacterium]|nr:hypothetical protein [Patescibacteria group bacterium]